MDRERSGYRTILRKQSDCGSFCPLEKGCGANLYLRPKLGEGIFSLIGRNVDLCPGHFGLFEMCTTIKIWGIDIIENKSCAGQFIELETPGLEDKRKTCQRCDSEE